MGFELISQSDLPNHVGLDAFHIGLLIEGQVFPPPIKVSKKGRSQWWLKSEVQGWHERGTFERWSFVIRIGNGVEVEVLKGSKAHAEARRHRDPKA